MVITIVAKRGTFAKLRGAAKDGRTARELRSTELVKSSLRRSERRNKKIALREQRRAFFAENSIEKLGEYVALLATQKPTKGLITKINRAFSLNAKKMSRMDMLKYADSECNFPTKRMKQRFDALGRKEMRAFYRSRKIDILKTRREANKWSSLNCGRSRKFVVSDEPEDAMGHRIVIQKKRDFNPKQNFVYKSKHMVPAHPYAGMKFGEQLQAATIMGDGQRITLIRRIKYHFDTHKIHHDIYYRNSFKRLAVKTGNQLCMAAISAFEDGLDVDFQLLQNSLDEMRKIRNKCLRRSRRKAVPQMENPDAHGEGNVQTIRSDNVLLTEARDTSSDAATPPMRWHRMNTEDIVGNYTEMVDRFHVLERIQWTGSTKSGERLASYDLPNFVLTADQFKNLVSIVPFHSHRMWRGDMEIRIDLNSNKFQVGQLQCSFYYGLKDMQQSKLYDNVVTLSQTTHGLLDAGGSNSVSLKIPFKYHSPMLCLSGCGVKNAAYIGTLNLYVLNNLKYATGNPDSADIVINFRFLNSDFSGQIARSLSDIPAIPEMEAVTMMAAMKLLDTVASDPNRDNPPYVAPAQYVVPQPGHSWSVGTDGPEPINPLRLSQGAQTRHPQMLTTDEHSTVFDLTRVFSYTKTIVWRRAQKAGELISSWNVSPDYYDGGVSQSGILKTIPMSPLQVMSNQFMQWRGSQEIRFDIICGQFHTGRLLVAFIPATTTDVSIDEAMSSTNIQFDLCESRSFTYVVPFVHYDAWIRRQKQMDGLSPTDRAYGRLHVFVLTALNCPETVPNEIDMNIYVRAGSSFELSVPIQPTIGLAFNQQYIPSLQSTVPSNSGQDDFYIGFWTGEEWDNVPFCRWGPLAGHVCDFPSAQRFDNKLQRAYYVASTPVKFTYSNGTDWKTVTTTYFAIFKISGYYVATPCVTKKDATAAVAEWKRSKSKTDELLKHIIVAGQIKDNDYVGKKCILTRVNATADGEGERANAPNLLEPTNALMHAGFGRFMYGEAFNSLKDIMRRYQLYGTVNVDANHVVGGLCLVKFPVVPSGLDLAIASVVPNMTSNKCREGLIPLILSAFRFYRGSIRFRIVVEGTLGSVWVQHRPECVANDDIVQVRNSLDSQDELPFYAHGYGSYWQYTLINNIVEFEVPFYQPGMYGLLQDVVDDKLRVYNSNGIIMLGIPKPTQAHAMINVFYSLADDFSFNTFQGFPLMIDADAIDVDLKAPAHAEMESVVGKMLGFDSIQADLITILNGALTDVAKVVNESLWLRAKSFFIFLCTQIAHLVTNFSLSTLVISIVGLFSYIGFSISDGVDRIADFVYFSIKRFFPDSVELLKESEKKQNPKSGNVNYGTSPVGSLEENLANAILGAFAKPNSATDDREYVAGWFSLIFTALTSYFGCTDRVQGFNFDKAVSDFMSARHFKSGSAIFQFVKLNYITLTSMFEYICGKLNPTFIIDNMFGDSNGATKAWLEETRNLLAVSLTSEAAFVPEFADRVEVAVSIGRELMEGFATMDMGKMLSYLTHMEKRFEKLVELSEKLKKRGQYAFKRPKPLHIQLYGAPGRGKTVFADHLSEFVLREVCHFDSIPVNNTCVVKAGAKFWDQCTGSQPVVLLDDLWASRIPDILATQVMNYIELYGDTIFSPPKAAVEDKEMRYAPTLIISTTNHPWVDLCDMDNDAIWRRMDVLLKVEEAPQDPEGHPDCPHCTQVANGGSAIALDAIEFKHLADFHHLRFYIADPMRAHSVNTAPMNYEQLKVYLRNKLSPIQKKNADYYHMQVERALRNAKNEEHLDTLTLRERIDYYRARLVEDNEKSYRSLWSDITSLGANVEERCKHYRSVLENAYDIARDKAIFNFKPFATAEQENIDCSMLADNLYNRTHNFNSVERDFILKQMKNRDNEINNLEENRIDIRHFVHFGKGPLSQCKHLLSGVIHGDFVDNHWVSKDGKTKIPRNEQCAGYCILDSNLFDLFMDLWLDSKPIRRMFLRRKIQERIPWELSAFENDETYLSSLAKAVKDFISSIPNPCAAILSALKSGWEMVSYCFKLLLRWLPVIIPILGIAGVGYFVHKEHQIAQHKYNGGLKAAQSMIDQDPSIVDGPHLDAWKVQYALEHQKALHRIGSGIPLDAQKYHYAENWPGMPAFPQHNNYAIEATRVPKARVPKPIPRMARSQASSQQASAVERIVTRNCFFIHVEYVNGDGVTCNQKFMCNGLYDRRVLVLKHFYETWIHLKQFNPVYKWRFAVDHEKRVVGNIDGMLFNPLDQPIVQLSKADDENGKPMSDCNWMVMDMTAQFPPCKNIVKFFASQNEHKYVHGQILFVRPGDATQVLPVIKNPHSVTMAAVPGGEDLTMETSYVYNRHLPGFCGSTILTPNAQHPIIGYHVAEWNDMGCAEPVYRESFEETPTPERPVVEVAMMPLNDVEFSTMDIDACVYPHGTVPKQFASSNSPETQYVPSIAAGELYEVTTEPMPLSVKDPRCKGICPIKAGAEKHGKVAYDFPNNLLEKAKQDLQEKLIALCKPVRDQVEPLSLQEAICGDVNVPAFTPLKWTSSEGFPLVFMRPAGQKGKTWCFDMEMDPDPAKGYILKGMCPELTRLYASEMVMRKMGVRCNTININCPKDEVCSKTKANTPGKTRTFSTTPIQYIIPFRQYFGDFMAAYRSNRIRSEHAIGTNPDGPEWAMIARYIQEQGTDIIAGDYSAFGDSLNSNVMKAAFDIIRAWYDHYSTSETLEEDHIVRGCLAAEATNPKRLCRNLIYESPGGISSGFPATDILNSMVNCLYVRVMWMLITKTDMVEFNKHCNVLTYGDDILINVHSKYSQIFNTQTMSDEFAKYNIKFTDCDKSGTIVPLRNLTNSPFLKRNFVPHPTIPGQFLAKIEETSIGNCLNWVNTKDNPLEAFIVNAQSALGLAFGWGPEYYEKLRKNIKEFCAKHSTHILLKSWFDVNDGAFNIEK